MTKLAKAVTKINGIQQHTHIVPGKAVSFSGSAVEAPVAARLFSGCTSLSGYDPDQHCDDMAAVECSLFICSSLQECKF